MFACILIKWKT